MNKQASWLCSVLDHCNVFATSTAPQNSTEPRSTNSLKWIGVIDCWTSTPKHRHVNGESMILLASFSCFHENLEETTFFSFQWIVLGGVQQMFCWFNPGFKSVWKLYQVIGLKHPKIWSQWKIHDPRSIGAIQWVKTCRDSTSVTLIDTQGGP